jgi:hypothetical protein
MYHVWLIVRCSGSASEPRYGKIVSRGRPSQSCAVALGAGADAGIVACGRCVVAGPRNSGRNGIALSSCSPFVSDTVGRARRVLSSERRWMKS